MDTKFEEIRDELNLLKKIDTNSRRSAFVDYCKKNIKLEEKGDLNIREASYNICGICSLFSDQVLPEFEEVMDIACDLELPDEFNDRKKEDWNRLKIIINKA